MEGLQTPYDFHSFVHDTHKMYLNILLVRYEATQVLNAIPNTPTDIHAPTRTICFSPTSLVQLQGEVSPISVSSVNTGLIQPPDA